MTAPIDITPAQLQSIQDILAVHLPADVQVWVFGSRANYTSKDSSDLDLALQGPKKLILDLLHKLEIAFDEEASLPYTVDVIDLRAVNGRFKKIVEEQKVALPGWGKERAKAKKKLPKGWREVTVTDVCEIFIGGTPKRSETAYWGGPVKWASARDIANCQSRYLRDTEQSITQKGIEESAARLLKRDTVIITARGTVGALCMLGRPMSFNQTCYGLVGRPSITSHYLYYALKAIMAQIHSVSYGTIFDTITIKSFKNLIMPLPNISEQRAIGEVLSALDDKIEINRQMCQTLEEMASALFQSWFVDFEPVKAKAAGKKPEGLAADIAALFPDSFVDSEMGQIPKGWKVIPFVSAVEILRDKENPFKSPDVLFQHFSIPAYDEGQWPKSQLGESIKSQKSIVQSGVVLLSRLNPNIPRVWLVDISNRKRAVCSTEFLVLCSRSPFCRSFIYCLCKSTVFQQTMESLVTGTSKSHQRVQHQAVLDLKVIQPPDKLIKAFDKAVAMLLKRTMCCYQESRPPHPNP